MPAQTSHTKLWNDRNEDRMAIDMNLGGHMNPDWWTTKI